VTSLAAAGRTPSTVTLIGSSGAQPGWTGSGFPDESTGCTCAPPCEVELVHSLVSVPFRTLRPVNAPVKEQILTDIAAMIDDETFLNGAQVGEFEEGFAAYCRAASCVGMSSGTDALRLGLLAAGIEPGDEVLVPANSFIATYAAIRQAGGVPVLVDVTRKDYNLDLEAAEAAITPRTRFLMPVHLYGQMADMRAVLELAERHSLLVLEDAAQAHGAERDGLRAGSTGLAAGFSFWPGKNLGAIGDAGALVTIDTEVDARARALRDHGQFVKHEYALEGYTARLDTVQAIALLHKLPLLDGWNDERRAAAAYYNETLAGIGDLLLPPVADGSDPVWHLYPLGSESISRIRESFAERRVGAGRHAPQPPHLAPAFAWLGRRRGELPVTEWLAENTILIPLFPGIEESELAAVVDAVAAAFDSAAR
jgi:dTDP-3-amino-3,4,6-trideoxy-alpha-D-glucose transaminase